MMSKEIGKIITFYSYKGGVGRSMTLVNVACLLAQRGKRVLIIDFDLEAPGIEKYFITDQTQLIGTRKEKEGIVDLIYKKKHNENFNWKNNLLKVNSENFNIPISILSAGIENDSYIQRLQKTNWEELFSEYQLGEYFEQLREEWKKQYDYILVDSRTGITDIGGICTIYLPDVIVFLFTANDTSLDGCINIITRVKKARQELQYDRNNVLVIPLPSRDESRTELEASLRWKEQIEKKLHVYYEDWLPKTQTVKSIIDVLRIPYIPYWSFGERLPVLEEGITDPNSIGFSFNQLTKLIINDFVWNEQYNHEVDNAVSSKIPVKYIETRVDASIDWYDKKSRYYKILYFATICIQIIGAALIPLLSILNSYKYIDYLIGFDGLLISIATGALFLGKYQERYLEYRKACEALKREKYLYLSSNSYQKSPKQFVEAVEAIIDKETHGWHEKSGDRITR